MDYKYIEQLLSRYFEATASLKEEQILKAFFAQDDEELPEALRQYKPLFEAMEKGDVLDTDFDDRILSLIGRQTTDNSQSEVSKARIISLQERFRPLLRAAAVVAVILTLSTAINQSFRNDNVWTDEDQIAHYQDEIRKAALAAATADSVLLYSEGISIKADSLAADTMHLAPTGYLE
ncbi:MAG: pyruvate ferredoxin oxidoreductase [Prevotella sp.]|nr:pyruvate ferredoxin oxidoreductase [Prevotella sp.]